MESSVDLANRIAAAASAQGHELGWSLYYCPRSWVDTARLATIGLNPGGGRADGTDWRNRCQLEDPVGNSYIVQRWGADGGKTTLQRQIATLFDLTGVTEEEVVSLNAVPFRSPTWKCLGNRQAAVNFGLSLVGEALVSPRLRLVVGFGLSSIREELTRQLGFVFEDELDTGWGRIKARRYRSADRTLLLLPHLSRFAILGRPEGHAVHSAIADAMRD